VLDNVGKATLTVALVDNGSTDNCGISSRTLSKTLFNCSDIGAAQNIILTATDASGNSSTCTAAITTIDNTAPTAVCMDVTVKLGPNGTVAVYSAQLAVNSTDNCSVWSYSPTVKVYTAANLGPNNLTITVKDFSGNASTCVSVVTVEPHTVNQDKPLQRDKEADALVSVDAMPEDFGMFLFPNPSAGDAQVQFQLPAEQEYLLRVFDLAGRQVFLNAAMGNQGQNLVLIRMDGMAKGLYLVELRAGLWRAVRRLVLIE